MSEIFYSPRGKRKLSSFLGRELLYDYITDQLDGQRKKSVEEYLQEQREAQSDLQKIKAGITYASSLQKTEVSPEFLQRIMAEQNYSETVYSKIRYHDWPEGIKFGLKIVGVTAIVVLAGLLTPWSHIRKLSFDFSGPVVLTEVSRNEKMDLQNDESVIVAPVDAPAYVDEGTPTATKPTLAANTKTEKENPSTPPSPLAAAKVASANAGAVTVTPTTMAPKEKEKATTGFLYRGSVSITNVSAITPKLVQRLEELGGRKAGSVPLGWKKGTGSYFHFTVPQGLLEKVEALFNEYGKLQLTKEKHERVMPEGIVRIIVEVEENNKSR